MSSITPEIRRAIEQAGDEPLRLEDPETHMTYILVKEDVYRRMRAVMDYDDGPLTEQEKLHLLREFGKRGGWKDPEMDIYDNLE